MLCGVDPPPFLVIRRLENCFRASITGEDKDHQSQSVSVDQRTHPVSSSMILGPILPPANFQDTSCSTTPDGQDLTHSNTVTELEEILSWGITHVRELASNSFATQQINHLYNTVLARYRKYYKRVTANLNAHVTPRTFEHPDVVFLP